MLEVSMVEHGLVMQAACTTSLWIDNYLNVWTNAKNSLSSILTKLLWSCKFFTKQNGLLMIHTKTFSLLMLIFLLPIGYALLV